MRRYEVLTPGPCYKISAPNLPAALRIAETHAPKHRGWTTSIVVTRRARVGYVRVFNSRGRKVTGACVRREG